MRVALTVLGVWVALNALLLGVWFAYGRLLRQPPRGAEQEPPAPAGADLGERYFVALVEALEDPYPPTRREAIRALCGLGDARAVAALTRVASGDPSSEVRDEAVEAIRVIRHRQAAGEAG